LKGQRYDGKVGVWYDVQCRHVSIDFEWNLKKKIDPKNEVENGKNKIKIC